MAIEKWLGITSVALFAMFVGEMISVYNFMIIIPEDDGFLRAFEPDPKIIQFISIGVSPAGILAGVAFIMSRKVLAQIFIHITKLIMTKFHELERFVQDVEKAYLWQNTKIDTRVESVD